MPTKLINTSGQRLAREQLLAQLGQHCSSRGPATGLARRMAVESMLRDATWARWADAWIAQHVGVDARTVATIRRTLETLGEVPFQTNTIGSDGTMFSRGIDPAARRARQQQRRTRAWA